MAMKRIIQDGLAKLGIFVQLKPPHDVRRRIAMLRHYGINTVFDVGANVGQYAGEIRHFGYGGTIHSFEPLTPAFQLLSTAAKNDPRWQTHPIALGSSPGEGEINVSQNSYSSSLRDLMPEHLSSAPESAYVGKEKITISTVAEQFGALAISNRDVWLKIDTQGFEREVLLGAEPVLSQIKVIQIEISLQPLYDQGMQLEESLAYFLAKGYDLVGLEPGFYNKSTGHQLQVDGVFVRK
jgi:FkbM family methyltransferase